MQQYAVVKESSDRDEVSFYIHPFTDKKDIENLKVVCTADTMEEAVKKLENYITEGILNGKL